MEKERKYKYTWFFEISDTKYGNLKNMKPRTYSNLVSKVSNYCIELLKVFKSEKDDRTIITQNYYPGFNISIKENRCIITKEFDSVEKVLDNLKNVQDYTINILETCLSNSGVTFILELKAISFESYTEGMNYEYSYYQSLDNGITDKDQITFDLYRNHYNYYDTRSVLTFKYDYIDHETCISLGEWERRSDKQFFSIIKTGLTEEYITNRINISLI